MSKVCELSDIYYVDSSIQNNFNQYYADMRRQVDINLSKLISSVESLRLYPQMKYALISHGKRLRPIIVQLSSEGVGGNSEKTMPLALALELIHTATLVHDDIIDGDQYRRNSPALYRHWKDKAILGGDALFVLAVNIVTEFGVEIMKVISKATLEVCDGEFMDVSLLLNNTTEYEYFLKIRKKSASLFKAAAQCGAIAGGGNKSEIEALSFYGEFFGIAYQLNDDLQEVLIQKVPTDFINGCVTLPYIHLYMNSDRKMQEFLNENFGKRRTNISNIQKIQKKLKELGTIDYCKEKIFSNLDIALQSVKTLKNSESKDYLTYLAHLLIKR